LDPLIKSQTALQSFQLCSCKPIVFCPIDPIKELGVRQTEKRWWQRRPLRFHRGLPALSTRTPRCGVYWDLSSQEAIHFEQAHNEDVLEAVCGGGCFDDRRCPTTERRHARRGSSRILSVWRQPWADSAGASSGIAACGSDGAPRFEPGNGGIKIHLFALYFNDHSEKFAKFYLFSINGLDTGSECPVDPIRPPGGAPSSVAATRMSGRATPLWAEHLCSGRGGRRFKSCHSDHTNSRRIGTSRAPIDRRQGVGTAIGTESARCDISRHSRPARFMLAPVP
jgi:hypothetical protein